MPLTIPKAVWEDISIDFITGLPTVQGKSVIIVVVDRLSKFSHFGALKSSYTASSVADYFINSIIRLHGYPKSITSDRDKVFTSKFWKELNRLNGTKLNMSSAYHPQTDGQTEVVNRCLEAYLRAMVHDSPKKWLKILPWAELWHNSNYNASTGMTPFMALYGREAPLLPGFSLGKTPVDAVEQDLVQREIIIQNLKKNYKRHKKT